MGCTVSITDLLQVFNIRPDLKRERVLNLHRSRLAYTPSPLLSCIVTCIAQARTLSLYSLLRTGRLARLTRSLRTGRSGDGIGRRWTIQRIFDCANAHIEPLTPSLLNNFLERIAFCLGGSDMRPNLFHRIADRDALFIPGFLR